MAFATATDVSDRLMRALTAAETTAAEAAIETVTGLIADAASRDGDWAADLDPVPETLRALCVEKAVGVIVNPANAASESKDLGAASLSRTFPRSADGGIFLTEAEERRVTWSVYGSNSASSTPRSVMDRNIDILEGRDVDDIAT